MRTLYYMLYLFVLSVTETAPTGSDLTGSDRAGSDSTGSDPTGSDPTGSDPTGSDPTDSEMSTHASKQDHSHHCSPTVSLGRVHPALVSHSTLPYNYTKFSASWKFV